MMIPVDPRNPAGNDAAKAKKITESGRSIMFTGDPRQLNRIRKILAEDPEVHTFFGDQEFLTESLEVRTRAVLYVSSMASHRAEMGSQVATKI